MKSSIILTSLISTVAVVRAIPVPGPTPVSIGYILEKKLSLTDGIDTKNEQPDIPSASTAKSLLASLTETSVTDVAGYARDEFKTWDEIEGNCNTR
jgi:hypothetical protein